VTNFEVCRLRDVPILTFVNKLDRESRDPSDRPMILKSPVSSVMFRIVSLSRTAGWVMGVDRDL
jgi:peptide subunit release factor RF-3